MDILEKLSQISTIFYFGLEGIGGLEMEIEEDENVQLLSVLSVDHDH